MIAIETNVLVYAHRSDSAWNAIAFRRLGELVASGSRWAIPWHCLNEFYAIVTHPKIYKPASTISAAIRQIEIWLGSPTLTILGEDCDTWPVLRDLIAAAGIVGGAVHDARIAAVCLQHGVTELWTSDRDFLKFPTLRVRNPLIEPPTRAGERHASYSPRSRSARGRQPPGGSR